MIDGNGQERIFKISTTVLSLIGLTADMLGIGKLAYDVVIGENLDNLIFKIMILFLAFAFGAGLGIISIKGFKNATIPMATKYLAWLHVVIIVASYVGIAFILKNQNYAFGTYIAFISVLGAELLTLIGLHAVINELNMYAFSVPILSATLLHLIIICYAYVFKSATVSFYLMGDLFLFLGMSIIGSAMLGDVGFISMIKKIIERISD